MFFIWQVSILNELIILHGIKPRQMLQTAFDRNIPLMISYLSDGKWQTARVVLTELGEGSFEVKVAPRKKLSSADIIMGQSIGVSFKYGYGRSYDKFIFNSAVLGFKHWTREDKDEKLLLAVPEQIEVIQRRSFYRVNVPSNTLVAVEFWDRSGRYSDGRNSVTVHQFWHGRLLDISVGGIQVAVNAIEKPNFWQGQSLGLKFTPSEHETPLMFNARLKSLVDTADGKSICLGLETVGLEASPEGRMIIQRICNVMDNYSQANEPKKD